MINVAHTRFLGLTLECPVTLKPQQTVIFDAGNIDIAATKEQADKFEFHTPEWKRGHSTFMKKQNVPFFCL